MKLRDRSDTRAVGYFDAVRRLLLDVPWSRRQPMLAELVGRLDELGGSRDPHTVLGAPEAYAALMRESAGFGPKPSKRFAYVRAWRLRRKVLVVTAIVATVTTIGVTRFVATYQPVTASLVTTYSSARPVDTSVPSDAEYWHYKEGAKVVVGFDVRNRGRFAVTIRGVESPSGAPIRPERLRATRDDMVIGQWQRVPAVQAVSVQPGERVFVFVEMTMVPWRLGAGDFTWQSLPALDVEVLGHRHVVAVTGDKIGVEG